MKRRETPLVSVIIPAWNCGRTLEIAAQSILDQTLSSLELIIVNDGSEDDTEAVARQLARNDNRVRIAQSSPSGLRRVSKSGQNTNAGWNARNKGMELARGRYVTFQDADDWSLLNRLEIQLDLIRKLGVKHLTTSCFWAEEKWLGNCLDLSGFQLLGGSFEPGQDSLALKQLAKKTEGFFAKALPWPLYRFIPFDVKMTKPIRKLFFSRFDPFPGAANAQFFEASVSHDISFRPPNARQWPSARGRGADRDFAFQIASKFGSSAYVDVPLYAWSTPTEFRTPWPLDRLLYPKGSCKGPLLGASEMDSI